jgi:N-acetylmuramoyl-L-alanine amidase
VKRLIFLFVLVLFSSFAANKQLATLPPYNGDGTQKPLIYLDPGHGGLDFGAIIKSPHCVEKRLCLTTAHYTKRYLEKMGYRVSLTRSRDFFVSLQNRVHVANRANAGIYVGIHYNSCPNPEVSGIEVYYYNSNDKRSFSSKRLASNVLNKSVLRTHALSRGVRKGNFYIIRETDMPSILIEAGFLTNQKERSKIKQRVYLEDVAKGIADGIDQFVKRGS